MGFVRVSGDEEVEGKRGMGDGREERGGKNGKGDEERRVSGEGEGGAGRDVLVAR